MALGISSFVAPVHSLEVSQLRVIYQKPVQFLGTMRSAPMVQLDNRIQQLEADVKELKDFNTKLIDGLRDAKDVIDEDTKIRQAKAGLVQIVCVGGILFILGSRLLQKT